MSKRKSPAFREAILRRVTTRQDRYRKEANQIYRFKNILRKPKA